METRCSLLETAVIVIDVLAVVNVQIILTKVSRENQTFLHRANFRSRSSRSSAEDAKRGRKRYVEKKTSRGREKEK